MTTRARVWLGADDADLDELRAVVEVEVEAGDHPYADRIEHGIPIYDGDRLRGLLGSPSERRALQAEFVRVLTDGPGIVALSGAFADTGVVDRATEQFRAMIEDQRAEGAAAGDHFAKPGANDRVWNALEKLAVRSPEVFVDYYANDLLAAVAEAWLGPGHQVTSQVNVVNPGGAAQDPHRDYHLGFMTPEQAAAYPAHVHRLSPTLTLQGAVAHGDMPLESGPTLYLPHSHKYEAGYLAWPLPSVRDYFEANHVQLPLATGDAVFFNPAVLHAAGHNRTTDVARMANLLQVSSAFGRAMETVDRRRMVEHVYPVLRRRAAGMTDRAVDAVVAACAEGYPFPTNLDRDPPVDGLAPPSMAAMVRRALQEDREPEALRDELRAAAALRQTT